MGERENKVASGICVAFEEQSVALMQARTLTTHMRRSEPLVRQCISAGRKLGGSASTSSSTNHEQSQRIADFSDILQPQSRRREQSPIRALMPFLGQPGMISLGGGLPNPKTFPFSKLTVDVPDLEDTGETQTLTLEGAVLDQALQYSSTTGLPPLVAWLSTLQEREHAVTQGPNATHQVTVTTGSQDALARVFEMVLGTEDTLLLEDATYTGALSFLHPLGCHLKGVQTDDGGLVPEDLERTLNSWPTGSGAPPKPRVLYTVPTGSNPTGISLSTERKRRIYEIASRPENDLLILEDDPYYFLRFDDESAEQDEEQPASFLSMDIDQRVVRFDSLSKILSAGLRIGFCTAPPAIAERLQLHMQATCLHTCGVSQAIAASLLNHWGHDKFVAHTRNVADFYKSQRDAFIASAERHLGQLGPGKVSWTVPDAGMFVWLDLSGTS